MEAQPSNSLLDGFYDEEEQARQFQEALKAWRTGGTKKEDDKKEEKQEKKVGDHILNVHVESEIC